MKLTVIIVNYNVEHFLYQSVDAALRALENIEGELIVVDNNSPDASVEMIQREFPNVQLIANTKNTGFATANNQGIKIAKGEYCLLLNPDTIVKEDTFKKCVDFMDANPLYKGLGIKMIDGSGTFLPESKRSFPSPKVAFYKLFGLANLFPNNNLFGQYHLSYLNKNENHTVDVLSGAFLMAPTEKLQEIGGLDETFFMYGEDIDLSWRLKEGGFENVYFADSQIIHYKGESTKKGSLNYVKRFYEAMIIFAEKHFTGKKASTFIGLMKLAVYFRALITLIQSFIKRYSLRIAEFGLGYALLFAIQHFWGQIVEINYPDSLRYLNLPIYLLLTLFAMHFSGANDKPYKFSRILRGSFIALLLCSISYAFLPEHLRFSRALVVLSVIAIGLLITILRMFIQYRSTKNFGFYGSQKRKAILVGDETSLHLANDELFTPPFITYLGLISANTKRNYNSIASITEFENVIKTLKPTDILFDTEALTYTAIVDCFELAGKYKIKCHTALQQGRIILSSHSKDEAGNVLQFNQNYLIVQPSEKRKKRLFDISTSLVLLFLSPILMWFQASSLLFIKNCFSVLFGLKTLVGYNNENLPQLKPSLLEIGEQIAYTTPTIKKQQQHQYAKFYTVYEDFDIVLKNWQQLG